MSSLFSIGEDELDLDDEDCLLAVCDVASSVNCIAENSNKNSGSKQNQLGSHVQLLRTKEVDKFNSHYSRRPFESLSNINSYGRVSDKKITSTEQLHGGTSFRSKTDCQSNSVTATPNGYNEPLAKRFAADHNSTSKPLSENRASLLRSSNSPVFKNTCDSSTFSRDTTRRDSRFVQCNSRPSDSHEAFERMDPLHNDSSRCNLKSNFSSGKEISGHNQSTFNSFRAIPMHASNTTNVNTTCTSSVVQQRRPPRSSPIIICNNQTRDLPQQISRTSSPLHNQPERNLSYSFNRNMNTTKAPETPIMCRERTVPGLSTPQVHQATTPVVNKSCTRTPFGSKTPKTRKFPGPAGLLPKLNPGQNLDDSSVVSPLPSMRKKSPVEDKVHVSQSNVSEEEDFNRDPWTYMHQDFVKNVPMSMRYTIIQVYTEAIQQRLDHGKVPCLCALVKAFSLTEADASVLLKDPTGEIHGTLHRKVLEKFQNELAPGAGLILKHVSVFSPAPRKHYLNITPGNILQIYPPDPQYMSSSQALASQCTQVESKQEQQSVVIEDDDVNKIADCNKETNTSDEKAPSAKEDEWMQKDCFEDLLEGLDDDEDFLDEALLL